MLVNDIHIIPAHQTILSILLDTIFTLNNQIFTLMCNSIFVTWPNSIRKGVTTVMVNTYTYRCIMFSITWGVPKQTALTVKCWTEIPLTIENSVSWLI